MKNIKFTKKNEKIEVSLTIENIQYKGIITRPSRFVFSFHKHSIHLKDSYYSINFSSYKDNKHNSGVIISLFLPPVEKAQRVFFDMAKESVNFIKNEFNLDDIVFLDDSLQKEQLFSAEMLFKEKDSSNEDVLEQINDFFFFLEREKDFEKKYLLLNNFGKYIFNLSSRYNILHKMFELETDKLTSYFLLFLKTNEYLHDTNYFDELFKVNDKDLLYEILFEKKCIFYLTHFLKKERFFNGEKERIKEKFSLKEDGFNRLFKKAVKDVFDETNKIYKQRDFNPEKEVIKIIFKLGNEANDNLFYKVFEFFKKEEVKSIKSLKKYVLMDLYFNQSLLKKNIKDKMIEKQRINPIPQQQNSK